MNRNYLLLGLLQSFTALGAIPAGILFIMEPSGALMGNTPEMLANSPFDSFLIPGIFLLVFIGIDNLTGAIFSFRKNKLSSLAGIVQGTVLILWILLQVWWIGLESFLQPLFILIGIADIILGIKIYKSRNVQQ